MTVVFLLSRSFLSRGLYKTGKIPLFSSRTTDFPILKQFNKVKNKNFPDRLIKTAEKCIGRLTTSSGKYLAKNGKMFGNILSGCLLIHARTSIATCYYEFVDQTRIVELSCVEMFHSNAKFDWKKYFSFLRREMWYILFAALCGLAVELLEIPILVAIVEFCCELSLSIRNRLLFIDQLVRPAIACTYLILIQNLLLYAHYSIIFIVCERADQERKKEMVVSGARYDIQQALTYYAHKTKDILSWPLTCLSELFEKIATTGSHIFELGNLESLIKKKDLFWNMIKQLCSEEEQVTNTKNTS